MATDQLEALTVRISAIERQNKRLKRACIVFGCMVAIGLFAGANVVNDSMEIREQLMLRDRNDKARFDMGVNRDNGRSNGLVVADMQGTRRIFLGVTDQGDAVIQLHDRTGKIVRQFE